jgi:predicted phage terminase large subunit-like protein
VPPATLAKPTAKKATAKAEPPPPRFTAADEERLLRSMAEDSLFYFAWQAWHVLEPETPFVDGWHIRVICQHLEAVTAGKIKKLIVNVPPRHMKSRIISVFWPVWQWLKRPWLRYITASYGAALSIQNALDARRLIEHPWFQERWGSRFKLVGDQNAKTKYDTDRTGYRLATSMGGAITGFGADAIVVDDPHNVKETESDAAREAVLDGWRALATRLNNPKEGAKVIVMQRVHERDLTGYLLEEEEGWEHVCLPAEYDGERRETSLGEYDPRTEEGELLWPELYGPAELAELKKSLQAYGEAGQLQQRPVPRKGGLFQRQWFEVVEAVPAELEVVRFWDRAATEGGGDWTVGLLLGRTEKGVFYLLDIVRFQGGPERVEETVKQTAEVDGVEIPVDLELQPAAAGKSEEAAYYKTLVGFIVRFHPATGSKVVRAGPVATQAKAGNVKLKKAPWNADFLAEAEKFPRAKKDDQVDALSGAFAVLITEGGGQLVTGRRADPRDLPGWRGHSSFDRADDNDSNGWRGLPRRRA